MGQAHQILDCYYCGEPFTTNPDGTTNHLNRDGRIDHSRDADHVPIDGDEITSPPEIPWRTRSGRAQKMLRGADVAKQIAAKLIDESIEFTCDPCPFDMWLFDVKVDQESRFARILEELGHATEQPA